MFYFSGARAGDISEPPGDLLALSANPRRQRKGRGKKATRGRGRGKKEFGSSRIKPYYQELSVTIGKKSGDVQRGEIDKAVKWLDENPHVAAYCFGVERGDTVFKKHIQMVIRVKTTSPAMFKTHLRAAIEWDKGDMKRDGSLCAKTLKYSPVHSWLGMLGYCTKDEGHPEYEMHSKNVLREEIDEGKEIYLQHGAANKSIAMLTPKNIVERAHHYQEHKLRRPTDSFMGTAMHMLGTQRYRLSPDWAGGFSGKVLDRDRVNLVWKSYTRPSEFTEEDLAGVLFNERDQERYHNSLVAQRLVQEAADQARDEAHRHMDDFMAEGGQPVGPGRAGWIMGLANHMRAGQADAQGDGAGGEVDGGGQHAPSSPSFIPLNPSAQANIQQPFEWASDDAAMHRAE